MLLAGAAGAGGASIRHGSEEAEAIAPAIVGAGLAASAGLGWLTRHVDPLGIDQPPEGLTPEALSLASYESVRARASNNKSTIIDNQNLIQNIDQMAYTEGKIAAIEALNNGLSQADVEAAALTAAEDYVSTIEANLLNSWNEAALELESIQARFDASSEIDMGQHFEWESDSHTRDSGFLDLESDWNDHIELADGTAFEVEKLLLEMDDSDFSTRVAPTHDNNTNLRVHWVYDGEEITYLHDGWEGIWNNLQDEITAVMDGLILWVDGVYADVQAGEIELSELITPRERSEMMADEETIAPAIADLIALNADVDPDREATITLVDDDVTLRGTFARTANPDGEPIESGVTYDPETDLTGDVYFTYDVAGGSGNWSDYETGVDGGTITFTSEPFEGVTYVIQTTAGETADVTASAFADNGDGTYSTDISGQLENSITEIESVSYYDDGDGGYETVLLKQSFTVEKFEDSDGNEVQEASFEQSSEPQTDSNYITQEEWDDLEQRNQELIEKYEDAQGGGGAFSFAGMEIPTVGVVAIAAGAIALLFGSQN